jgi:hypothetical protein
MQPMITPVSCNTTGPRRRYTRSGEAVAICELQQHKDAGAISTSVALAVAAVPPLLALVLLFYTWGN